MVRAGRGRSQRAPRPTRWLLSALTDMLWNEGHKAAAGPGLKRRDVEYIRHHGEHLDVRDDAAGGLRGRLEAGPALPVGSHSKPGHTEAA